MILECNLIKKAIVFFQRITWMVILTYHAYTNLQNFNFEILQSNLAVVFRVYDVKYQNIFANAPFCIPWWRKTLDVFALKASGLVLISFMMLDGRSSSLLSQLDQICNQSLKSMPYPFWRRKIKNVKQTHTRCYSYFLTEQAF